MTFWEYMNKRHERMMANPSASQWSDPRTMISFSLIGLFAWAFSRSPTDLMIGAIITAFAASYGYWIGSAKASSEQREMTKQALDVATSAQNGNNQQQQKE